MTIELANRLQKLRKEHGYTQESLADALGVSRQAVSKWECTEASPDTDNLIALARLYKMSLDDIVNGNEEPAADTKAENSGEGQESAEEKTEEENPDPDDEEFFQGGKHENKSGRIHININGIHIGDDDDEDDDDDDKACAGIHIEDKDGTSIHIGTNGIYVKDKDNNTKFKGNKMEMDGVHITSDDGTEIHFDGGEINVNGETVSTHFKRKKIIGVVTSLTVILSVAGYILLGTLLNLWHSAWIIFLAIPVIPSLAEAILKRKANKFCFPVFIAAIYLLMGFLWNLWHPGWTVFLTIPVFYIILDLIKKK